MNESGAIKLHTQHGTAFPTSDLSAAATLLALAEQSPARPARSAYRSAIRYYTRALSQFDAARRSNRLSDTQVEHIEGKLSEIERRIQALEQRRSLSAV